MNEWMHEWEQWMHEWMKVNEWMHEWELVRLDKLHQNYPSGDKVYIYIYKWIHK